MEVKLIEKKFGQHSNSVVIEYKDGGIKKVYDIRVKFNDMKVFIEGYGIKLGLQRSFKYMDIDSYEYRLLNTEDRKVYEEEFYKTNIPKEVANLALEEFVKSIEIQKF